ncbi:adenylate/guanylate cyclase domain-containing protein [Litorivicinus sp.]|nr:adenylate/guanylate cyclase domain-containing protein [Litorivicinus sp.]
MLAQVTNFLFQAKAGYPDSWKPAFLAMQLGFLAGALAVVIRILVLFFAVDEWQQIVFWEITFATVVGIGFLLHTTGRAEAGVLLACLGGVGSATAYILLLGWDVYFHIWYLNLAILLIAVPLRGWIKWSWASVFLLVDVLMFVFVSESQPLIPATPAVIQFLGVSNILGSLFLLGLPMAMYSHFLVLERKKSESLLHNIIPKDLANILREGDGVLALDNANVSVMFADIVGFTPLASKLSAREVVDLLNGIFSEFDDICRKKGIEKIKTIGDAYMAVAGLPAARADHAQILVDVGFEFLEIIKKYQTETANQLEMRIGIHSGDAVSGVIGKSKFSFDIWGDSVNLASRLESIGRPGTIHVSEETLSLLDKPLLEVIPQQSEIKGKGTMRTFLIRKK